MPEKNRPTYGRIALPAIGYWQGNRRMVSTVMSPPAYVGAIGEREEWDPLSGTGTNRREDKAHRRGIASYLESEQDYVLSSVLVYLSPTEANFVADDENASISMGTLYVDAAATMVVGDGGHRSSAIGDVVATHKPLNDDVFAKMVASGQPIIVVLDDNQVRRAQDFTDLQNNAKALNQSVAQSMDRRDQLNKVLLESLIKGSGVPCFDGGSRVEFLTDSPGKLSAKIASYKTIRYASGTLLVGTAHRSTKKWAEEVATSLDRDLDGDTDEIIEFWQGYSDLPDVSRALAAEKVALLRADTWLTSAYVMYALAAAVHTVVEEDDMTIAEAFAALHGFNFARTGTSLYGTLVDPPSSSSGTPKARTGRDAWEGAAGVFRDHIRAHTRAQAA